MSSEKNDITEEEFLKNYNPDKYKKPSLTADILIITEEEKRKILLIRRGNHPCRGKWAVPGGFSEENERIEETAARELQEETGIELPADKLTLVGVYSKPGRDPRGWTVSAAYLAIVDPNKTKPVAADDAADAAWFEILPEKDGFRLLKDGSEFPLSELAFDHSDIVRDAVSKIFPDMV